MGVKVTRSTSTTLELPALMADKLTGLIVFVTDRRSLCDDKCSGVCLEAGSTKYWPGHYTDHWVWSKLTPYCGTVSISNT